MTSRTDTPRQLFPLLPLWAALAVAAGAGLLMDLAYPQAGVWVAAPIAAGLLLCALIGRSAAGALGVGAVFGAVFFALLVSWTSRYLGPVPWLALTVVQAALTAVGVIPLTLAYRWMPRIAPGRTGRMLLLPLLLAALWTGREILMGAWPYGGFPWARLGMTQAESPVATISSWAGVSGLSFAIVFAVAVTIEWVRVSGWRRTASAALPVVIAGILMLVPAFPTTGSGTMRIGAVQGNGPSGYFDEREPGAIARAQAEASIAVEGEDLDLLVWPEGLDGDPFQDARLARELTGVAERAGAPLLANAATVVGDDAYNTSFLWDLPTGAAAPRRADVQTHAKRHPVPFGEYVPDREFYNALAPDLVGLIQREYTHGTDPPVVIVDGTPVGLAICFDVIYDDVIAESVRAGAQVLVFQTNNADFRDTDENLQQLAFARMRAIETGRSVVNVSTVGTSQIIAPDGTTVDSLPAGTAGALVADVELRTGTTPGVLLGPVLAGIILWGGIGALALTGVLSRVTRSRATDEPALTPAGAGAGS
ncbi:apolipoprotein N-acyltransferase [Microbacterium limosum]|uniref:Apolipoprotein N-acyltransferase n=1 Tax=Microbacterium limosum TaxID=3079935 RepID=A0AAU0MI95_9MICO|nr:apolipoprotein N-acyltransferase [Microbacterium sp. Y20]WOQ69850.1 apolipoprotein N-acyltransferase [Microbacterium sp. Y20]